MYLHHICSPQKLHLTAVSENILMENIDIFRKNGFEFQVDEDGMDYSCLSAVVAPAWKDCRSCFVCCECSSGDGEG